MGPGPGLGGLAGPRRSPRPGPQGQGRRRPREARRGRGRPRPAPLPQLLAHPQAAPGLAQLHGAAAHHQVRRGPGRPAGDLQGNGLNPVREERCRSGGGGGGGGRGPWRRRGARTGGAGEVGLRGRGLKAHGGEGAVRSGLGRQQQAWSSAPEDSSHPSWSPSLSPSSPHPSPGNDVSFSPSSQGPACRVACGRPGGRGDPLPTGCRGDAHVS